MTKQKRDARGRFLPVSKKAHACKCGKSGCKSEVVHKRIPEPTAVPSDITENVNPEIVDKLAEGLYELADELGLTASKEPVTIELTLTSGNRQITISAGLE